MPIKSYLVYPHDGKKEELIKHLSTIESCEVTPAENKDVLVLVTETENKTSEANLKEVLESIDSLKLLAMVSGFDTPQIN